MQASFLMREVIIITRENVWSTKLIIAQSCAWLVGVITLIELGQVSIIRERAPKAMDQVLDMLLLPMNYAVLSAHSLRLLGTAPKNSIVLDIVNATVDAADVWESWALWSVLALFASVVNHCSTTASRRTRRGSSTGSLPMLPEEPSRESSSLAPGGGGHHLTSELGGLGHHLSEPLLAVESIETFGDDDITLANNRIAKKGAKKMVTLVTEKTTGSFFGRKKNKPLHTREQRAISGMQKLVLYVVQGWVLLNFLSNSLEVAIKGIGSVHFPTYCYDMLNSCEYLCNTWYDTAVAPYSQAVLYALCTLAIYCVFKYEGSFYSELERLDPYWKFFGVKGVVSVTSFQWLILRLLVFWSDEWTAYIYYNLICCIELPFLALIHAWKAYPLTNYAIENEDGWICYLFEATEKRRRKSSDETEPPTRWQICKKILSETIVLTVLITSLSFFLYYSLLPENSDDTNSTQWSVVTCKGPIPNMNNTIALADTSPLGLCALQTFQCKLGYTGSASVKCYPGDIGYIAHGGCRVIGCGAPPEIPHAVIATTKSFWRLGQNIDYKCMRGYRGEVSCQCMTNGHYEVSGECTIVGCGASPPKLAHGVAIYSGESTSAGEEVLYKCDLGYQGQPSATCTSDGTWFMVGDCRRYQTVYGCKCEAAWIYCDIWGGNCQKNFGCEHANRNYQWCRVSPGSCPPSSRSLIFGDPMWDYCVARNESQPRGVPDRGFIQSTLNAWGPISLAIILLIVILVLYFVIHHLRNCLLSIRRQQLREKNEREDALLPASRRPTHSTSSVRSISIDENQSRKKSAFFATLWANIRTTVFRRKQSSAFDDTEDASGARAVLSGATDQNWLSPCTTRIVPSRGVSSQNDELSSHGSLGRESLNPSPSLNPSLRPQIIQEPITSYSTLDRITTEDRGVQCEPFLFPHSPPLVGEQEQEHTPETVTQEEQDRKWEQKKELEKEQEQEQEQDEESNHNPVVARWHISSCLDTSPMSIPQSYEYPNTREGIQFPDEQNEDDNSSHKSEDVSSLKEGPVHHHDETMAPTHHVDEGAGSPASARGSRFLHNHEASPLSFHALVTRSEGDRDSKPRGDGCGGCEGSSSSSSSSSSSRPGLKKNEGKVGAEEEQILSGSVDTSRESVFLPPPVVSNLDDDIDEDRAFEKTEKEKARRG